MDEAVGTVRPGLTGNARSYVVLVPRGAALVVVGGLADGESYVQGRWCMNRNESHVSCSGGSES